MSSSPVWKWTSDVLSEKTILSAERALKVTFPPDYRACVRENHGGAPEPCEFSVTVEGGRTVTSRVSLLLSLDTREDENVVGTARDMTAEGRLPAGLVPIADDGGGNLVCLDYRHEPPKISHLSIGSEIGSVAENFTEFLGKLK